MKSATKSKPDSSSRISVAWPPFAVKLAAVLEKLEEDQFLILSVKQSNRFVQFAAEGSYGIRAETTSNSYLNKHEQLSEQQIAALLDTGWHLPTGGPDETTPQKDPDGSPNYFAEFPVPVDFAALANLTVHTFAEILHVVHPGALQYEAFGDEGAIALPELGLKVVKRVPPEEKLKDLSQRLLSTIREETGISELDFDGEGDISIRYGSAMAFICLIEDPLCIRIFSPILSDVEESPDLFGLLNAINAKGTLIRFFYKNGVIHGIADISAAPFVSAHVIQGLAHFCVIADEMGNMLQAELGGQTAFVEVMPSAMRH